MAEVSVIIPVRNGAATLGEALASVLEPETAEVLVVDDGSTDATRAVAEGAGDPRVRILDGPCAGISAALNAGIEAARFDYVARCDADDRFVAGRLGRQLAWLEAHPDHVAISGGYATMTARGRKLVDLAAEGSARDVTDLLLDGHAVTHFCTWLTRRSALLAVGGARRWFVTAEDLDLQFRLAGEGRVHHDPRPVYLYRLHESSITHGQAEEERRFYEGQARRFARQRRKAESDDLTAGRPPAIVSNGGPSRAPTPAARQAAGQLEGAAWRRRAEGRAGEALWLMLRALRLDPLSPGRWRSLAAILLKRRK